MREQNVQKIFIYPFQFEKFCYLCVESRAE